MSVAYYYDEPLWSQYFITPQAKFGVSDFLTAMHESALGLVTYDNQNATQRNITHTSLNDSVERLSEQLSIVQMYVMDCHMTVLMMATSMVFFSLFMCSTRMTHHRRNDAVSVVAVEEPPAVSKV